ncbi:hypothetical protein AAVH_32277, partial [Aphelenchoides avenae]
MQVRIACTSCRGKAPLENLFRCETCRARFSVNNDQDVVLCSVCAAKHSIAFKAHELVEHRMASKRDIEKAITRIDQEPAVMRADVISANAVFRSRSSATEYFEKEANE